mgnify:CR=1 FL=1
MTENLKIEILGKLLGDKEIKKQYNVRNKSYLVESIKYEFLDEFISNGWSILKEFKTSVSIRKEKSNDVDFEDRVWCLFANLGYEFLNKDRKFNIPYDKNNIMRNNKKSNPINQKSNTTKITYSSKH